MNLKSYFAEHTGTGILATADREGVVNTALYARPHIVDEKRIAFIMRERLTHKNVLENPRASYLFKQDGPEIDGIRLRLTWLQETTDHAALREPSRKPGGEATSEKRYFVTFQVDQCLRLVGGEDIDIS